MAVRAPFGALAGTPARIVAVGLSTNTGNAGRLSTSLMSRF
jgi:hypothetical protein